MMTLRQKRKLKRLLPHEVRKQMAIDMGFSYSYINMVLWGSRNNDAIVERALEEAQKLKRKSYRQQKLVKSL